RRSELPGKTKPAPARSKIETAGDFPVVGRVFEFAEAILLDAAQIGGEGQLGDEGCIAPIGGQPSRVQVGDAPWVKCRGVIADKHVALGLRQIRIVVAQVERKRLVGEAYADVPGPVALVRHATGVHSKARISCW